MKKYFLIFILLAVALSLRLYHLDNRGLITDEKFTLVTSNGFWIGGANQSAFTKDYFTASDFWEAKSLRDYFDATAHSDFGTHIIHNGVIHYWTNLFGNSDFSIRLPGLIFNVLTVLLIFLMVLKYFNNYWAAFLAAFLFAVDPLNIAQSHIARSYPLSFFLILLSTEFFIRIIKGGNNLKNYLIYAVLVALSLLNHYINFFIPLGHILIFLTLKNKTHLWKGFIMAAVFNVAVLIYWFNWGGGYTIWGFMEDKDALHSTIANNPDDELSYVFQLATPEIISKKAVDLFFNIGVIGYDLFTKINGIKLLIFIILIFGLTTFWIKKPSKKNILLLFLALFMMALLYKQIVWVIVTITIFYAIYFGCCQLIKSGRLSNLKGQYTMLAMGCIMFVFPILFVVYDAFSSGNTTSLTHRYIGNASPFVVVLLGVGIVKAVEKNILFLLLFVFTFLVQTTSIKKAIQNYFADQSPYNAFFDPPRVKNPYWIIAHELETIAVKGDTIIIPGAYKNKYQERFEQDLVINYTDAQYLNLYFKPDFDVVQFVDRNEREKLFLKKKNGEKLLIFDFKGEEFRY